MELIHRLAEIHKKDIKMCDLYSLKRFDFNGNSVL